MSTIRPGDAQLQIVRPACVQVATCLAHRAAQLQLAKAHDCKQLGLRALAAWQAGARERQEKRSKQKHRVSEMQVRVITSMQHPALSPNIGSSCHM